VSACRHDKDAGMGTGLDHRDVMARPTACRYVDQIWRISVARRSGICALTRAAIRTRDRIYRRAHIRPLPVNLNFLILVTIVVKFSS
jgi:hypothetical protein